MPAKPTKPVKAQPYPYEIPSIEYLKERDPNILNPWDVQEFFRVEALLRSKTVMDLYRDTFSSPKKRIQPTDSLYMRYLVFPGWLVLKGHHHSLFRDHTKSRYSKVQPFHTSGISNLTASHKETSQAPDKGVKAFEYLKESILSENPKYLYLRIDATYPTKKIISGIKTAIRSLRRCSPMSDNVFHRGHVRHPCLIIPYDTKLASPWRQNKKKLYRTI